VNLQIVREEILFRLEEESIYEKGFLKRAGKLARSAALGTALALSNPRVPVSRRNSDQRDPQTSGEVYAADVEAAHRVPKLSAEILLIHKGPEVSRWYDRAGNMIVGDPNDPYCKLKLHFPADSPAGKAEMQRFQQQSAAYNQKFISLNIKIRSEDDYPVKITGISAFDRDDIPSYPKPVDRPPLVFNYQMVHRGDWVAVTKQPPNSEAGPKEIRVFTDRGVVTIPLMKKGRSMSSPFTSWDSE